MTQGKALDKEKVIESLEPFFKFALLCYTIVLDCLCPELLHCKVLYYGY